MGSSRTDDYNENRYHDTAAECCWDLENFTRHECVLLKSKSLPIKLFIFLFILLCASSDIVFVCVVRCGGARCVNLFTCTWELHPRAIRTLLNIRGVSYASLRRVTKVRGALKRLESALGRKVPRAPLSLLKKFVNVPEYEKIQRVHVRVHVWNLRRHERSSRETSASSQCPPFEDYECLSHCLIRRRQSRQISRRTLGGQVVGSRSTGRDLVVNDFRIIIIYIRSVLL